MKKITVIIPCYNEEKGIDKVVKNIPRDKLKALGYNTKVIVCDNNSNDKTSEVAKKAGAIVILEKKKGKGNAVQTLVKNISKDTDIVVMLDGDYTYKPQEMLRLVEPIDSGFSDVVLGSRLSGNIKENSMPVFNRAGNWLFTFMVRVFYHGNVTDVCTGYFAWKYDKLKQLFKYIEADHFTLEMEMVAKMARMNFKIISVPITYDTRGQSSSELKALTDGRKILFAGIENMFWKPYSKYKSS